MQLNQKTFYYYQYNTCKCPQFSDADDVGCSFDFLWGVFPNQKEYRVCF